MHRTGVAQAHVLWWQKGLTETHPWERDIADPFMQRRIFLELANYARTSDVVVFQMLHTREALSTFYAIKDAFPDLPVLSETDDDITYTPSYNSASEVYKPGSAFTALALEQFRHSDGLIVSTPYLKEVYGDYNKNIYVIPNCIDTKLWGKATNKPRPGIRIGWAGGASHNDDLEILKTIIPKIIKNNHDVKFVLIHGIPDFLKKIPGVECVRKWTRIDRYPKFIASQDWDIALAPLVDNNFNRAKSNLRWLEAGALGIPIVASKVGHFAETIHHGEDGFLAGNEDEFCIYIGTLIKDRTLRKKMGAMAKARIALDFNVDIVAKQYVAALDESIQRGRQVEPPTLLHGIEDDIKALEPIPDNAMMTEEVVQ